jgi:hypothetical protein
VVEEEFNIDIFHFFRIFTTTLKLYIQNPNIMKAKFFLLFMALILSGTLRILGQCADPANIYHFTFNSKDYMIVKEKKTWANASLCAVELGGYMAEINSVLEQDAIYDEITTGAAISPNYTTVPDGGGVAYIWIGATDQVAEGSWVWDGNNDGLGFLFWVGEGNAGAGGGHPVAGSYVNWGGTSTGTYHEPDNYGGNQDVAAIALRGWPSGSGTLGIEGEWNDISPANTLYFVVEKENTSGIYNGNNAKPLYIYPNPVKDKATIKVNRNNLTVISLSLFNLTGSELMSQNYKGATSVVLNLEQLAKGYYYVKVKLSDGTEANERILVM